MILVDTSVWVKLYSGSKSSTALDGDLLQRLATCPIVVQEVFQGLKKDHRTKEFKKRFLALPRFADPTPLSCFLEAADIYATGRRRGLTIRSSTDCLIAAIARQNDLSVWHNDRDFALIAKFTSLEQFKKPPVI